MEKTSRITYAQTGMEELSARNSELQYKYRIQNKSKSVPNIPGISSEEIHTCPWCWNHGHCLWDPTPECKMWEPHWELIYKEIIKARIVAREVFDRIRSSEAVA